MHAQLRPHTLVDGAIARPDEPRHFMVLRHVRGVATARVGELVIASSERALLVKEVGRDVYDPVVYFPPADVRAELLAPVEQSTYCPLKGTASYFALVGDEPRAWVAWSYQQVLDFDPRLTQIECCVAFDRRRVTVTILETS